MDLLDNQPVAPWQINILNDQAEIPWQIELPDDQPVYTNLINNL